jgi:hypothetical protein
LVEVRVAQAEKRDSGSVPGSTIEVRLCNGRSLLVGPGFDASQVRALLAVVEENLDSAIEVFQHALTLDRHYALGLPSVVSRRLPGLRSR